MASKGKSGKRLSKLTVVELEEKYKQYTKDGDIRPFSEDPPDDDLIQDALLIEDSQRDQWDWEDRDFVEFDGTWVYYFVARKRVGIKIPIKMLFDKNITWDFEPFPWDWEDDGELEQKLTAARKNCKNHKERKEPQFIVKNGRIAVVKEENNAEKSED